MANSGKCMSITAAAVSTVQSLASIAFGIYALMAFACIATPTPPNLQDPNPFSSFQSSFYLQYFHSQNNCIARNVSYWNETKIFEGGWNMTHSNAVQGWFIGYVAENSIWFISSILLFAGIAMNNRALFRIYSVTQGLVITYDIVLVIIFAIDFDSYNKYLGNPNTKMVTRSNMLIGIILMVLIFGRFVIFFAFNIVFVYVSTSSASAAAAPKPAPKQGQRRHSDMRQRPLPAAPPQDQQQFQQGGEPNAGYYPSEMRYMPPEDQRPPPDILINSAPRYVDEHPQFHHGGQNYGMEPKIRPIPPPKTRRPADPALGPSREALDQAHLNGLTVMAYPDEDYDSGSDLEGRRVPQPKNNDQETSGRNNGAPPRRRDKLSVETGGPRSGLRRNSSSASDVPELKNQRPWSYIRPDELPSSPNKLNQFYLKSSGTALPPVPQDPEEPSGDELSSGQAKQHASDRRRL